MSKRFRDMAPEGETPAQEYAEEGKMHKTSKRYHKRKSKRSPKRIGRRR
jgi:hypothetical protein